MEAQLVNSDATNSRAAKSNGTHRNPQRETKIACNPGSDSAHALDGFHHRGAEDTEKIERGRRGDLSLQICYLSLAIFEMTNFK
jgi:hypothetical protein